MEERQHIDARVAELRSKNKVHNNISGVFSTLLEEGYEPEAAIMWTGDHLTLS